MSGDRRYDVCASVISDLPFDARVWKESRSLAAAGRRLSLTGPAYDIERSRRRRDDSGVDVLEIPFGWRDRPKSSIRRLGVLAQVCIQVLRTPADVYHSHDIHVGPASWLAARMRGAKLVYDAHELWGEPQDDTVRARWIAAAGRLIERLMVASSDAVITTNASRADVLRRRHGRDDICVLANVPSLVRDVVPLDPGYPRGRRILLYQGFIAAEARCFRETVHALSMVDDDIDLVILGFGWDAARDQIRAWAEQAGVGDRVHFLPPRPWIELVATAAAATVGLVPIRAGALNHRLGDTNKLHEYLMGGLPVIASDLPEIRRIVTMGDPPVGELFDPSSPETIARALNAVLADPNRYAARRLQARALAEQHLNWELEERRLLELYDRLLSARCVVIASGPSAAAERAARRAGLEPCITITKGDCATALRHTRREARATGIGTVAIHSPDWSRQALPALFELAALRLRLPDCRVIDGAAVEPIRLTRARLLRNAASLPVEAAAAGALTAREWGDLARNRRGHARRHLDGGRDAVLAMWPGAAGSHVGGAVTHMAGILAALRRTGLRVALVALGPPPPQLAEHVDDLEIADAPPRAARLMGETAAIHANRAMREAGVRLLDRARPALLYQRHEAFVTYGVELARLAEVPLVLEWNNSEVWARRAWHVSNPLKKAFNPLATRMERRCLRRADLIAAVSTHSAAMAIDEGAPQDGVIVLPNGVDVADLDRAIAIAPPRDRRRGGRLVGWVGSFESWHGAEILIRALHDLPSDVGALLVGEGSERPRCETLARELGVHARIEWTGALPHDAAVQRLASCDVLASPHVPMVDQPFFGSPTKIFEYMAIGRPIVASSLEQIGEILSDGVTGRLVIPGDALDLARGIRSVLGLPDAGAQLGRAARLEAEAWHTWDARVRVLLASLQRRVGSAAPTAGLQTNDDDPRNDYVWDHRHL
jgi:glycosyltransferase involved in cell wall biosynthesis